MPACIRGGVVVTIQPDGVRRPVAVAAPTLVLALSQKLLAKHHLTRAGRWHDWLPHMGDGLVGRTLGVVGAGSIGKEPLALAPPFGLRLLATDPLADPAALAALGTELVPFETLLEQSDYLVVLVPLLPARHKLIGVAQQQGR